jgi:ribosomal protein L11 methyltransferase
VSGWQELVIEVGRGDAEPWSEALLEAGALSVQAEDADADSPDEQPLYGEPGMHAGEATPAADHPLQGWERTVLAALIAADAEPAAVLSAAAASLGRPAPPIREIRRIDDQDWVRSTQSQFEPIPIGQRLVITPSWHADSAATSARIPIVLDPGLAFGTGSHPTTRLCLQWLECHIGGGESVIDYGCGSGILAIAAAKLGARSVVAIDIDPQALLAATDNAQRNRVEVAVRATGGPPPAQADVVVANILSSPLKLLAPMLTALVRPGGQLVLSGVLERQVDEVSSAYRDLMPMRAHAVMDGWACLVASKPR